MRPVQIALRALEVLGTIQPAGVSELARSMNLPKSTIHRSLKALAAAGWIETDGTNEAAWYLSLHALIATGRADFTARNLRMAAIPVMEEVRRRCQESIYLAVLHKEAIALIERLDGIRPIVHAWPLWKSGPLHTTSLGKAILANLPAAELEAYLKRPLKQHTPKTVVDPSALRKELAVARKRGFAVAIESNWTDENGVGAAIRNSRGRAVAAIAISAPAERMSEADCMKLGPMLIDAARRITMASIP